METLGLNDVTRDRLHAPVTRELVKRIYKPVRVILSPYSSLAMPTPRFLVPIKDALKRDKGDCGHQVDKSSGNLVVKDYAAIPTPSESGTEATGSNVS